jgi:hypothetical protein
MRRRRIWGIAAFFCLVGIGLAAARAGAADAPRMTKDDLRALLGRPDVVIVDVRTERQWEDSKEKIPGAVREDPRAAASWGARYSKEKTIVIYCT